MLQKVTNPVSRNKIWMQFIQNMYKNVFANQLLVASARQRAQTAEEAKAASIQFHQRFAKDNQQDKSEIMLRCIDLINSKKRKIRNLMAERDRLKDGISQLKESFADLKSRVEVIQREKDESPSEAPDPRRAAPKAPKPKSAPKKKPVVQPMEVSEESEGGMQSYLQKTSDMPSASELPSEIPEALPSDAVEKERTPTKRTRLSSQASIDTPPSKRPKLSNVPKRTPLDEYLDALSASD